MPEPIRSTQPQVDLPKLTVNAALVAFLVGLSLWILSPFLPALLWACTIVIATWPVLLWLQGRMGGRRWAAVSLLMVALLILVVIPILLAVYTLFDHSSTFGGWAAALQAYKLPPPPTFLSKFPLVGGKLTQLWRDAMDAGPAGLVAMLTPYVGKIVSWSAKELGGVGMVVLQFLLTMILATILYGTGDYAAVFVRKFAQRIAGEHGQQSIRLATRAIRAVAAGVVLTAFVQAALGALGLWIANIPAVAVLAVVMFLLSVAQLGVGPVLLPVVVWVYWSGETGWGTFLLVWTVFVTSLDNVVRPLLIRAGANLPLLLVFAGVIGGLLAFGLVGIFVGPVVLAVTYTMLMDWVLYGRAVQIHSDDG